MEQTGATVNTGGDPNAHAHDWNVHSHPHGTRHIHCDCTIGDCKLHAQAPALLEALKALMPLGDVHQKDGWASDFDKAEAVIKEAK